MTCSSAVFLNIVTLEIRNNSQLNGLNVPDAYMLPVNSTEDVLKLMKIGQKNRAVGATALNERSSRSHRFVNVLSCAIFIDLFPHIRNGCFIAVY